jgi:hypothetical protein
VALLAKLQLAADPRFRWFCPFAASRRPFCSSVRELYKRSNGGPTIRATSRG